MKFRTVSCVLVVSIMALHGPARSDEKVGSASSQRFELLKKLAGDWVKADKDGKPTDTVVSSIRVTSAGTAVEETLFPGSDHEMVTMYHLDGDELILTHYCSLGNQPRLKAEAGGDPNRILFKFAGATNLKSDDEMHIHQATFTLDGADHFQAEWVANKDGKPCHQETLDLVRKPK
jgi:hypothetical protein